MKTTTTVAVLVCLFTAACAASPMRVGDVAVRVSAGAADTRVETKEERRFLGQTYTLRAEAEGTTTQARVELSTLTHDGYHIGAYVGGGEADFGEHATAGAIGRLFLTPGLYTELRAGGRYDTVGGTSGFGLDAGAAVGVEWRGLFAQVGYDYGTSALDDDRDAVFQGLGVMVGGTLRF